MKTTPLIFLTSACLVLSAAAELVPGGDFQLYKPGEHTVTATLTADAWAQWVASIPNPIDPTSLNVANGSAEYSDSTTGSTVDLLGWTKPQGGADILANGPGGSMALNLFAAWGGSPRPIVETIGSLHTIGAGDTITISTMVGGPAGGPKSGDFFFSLYAGEVEVVPSSVVDQSLPLDNDFQMISRTYDADALAAHIGQSTKIRIAIPDSNVAINRVIFDDVSIEGIGTGPPPIRFVISPTEGSPGNYDFEWDSQEGKLYDLVSATDLSTASSTWPVWDGREDLVAMPPVNNLTDVPGGGDPRRFFVLIETDVPPPPPLLAEDFESGTPAGWVFSDNGAGTAWSVGTPDGTGTEPEAAANGTLCAGTNMNGNYTASAIASLITPAFIVPAEGATLKFSQYIDTAAASGGGDFGSIRLLDAADDSPLAGGVVAPDLQGESEQWSSESLPLPAAANGLEVKLEFRFESDADTQVYAGFYIDDVVVEAVAP